MTFSEMNRKTRRIPLGFTLLEIVLAVAVFTVIAAPILGLLAMTVQSGEDDSNLVRAEELKRVVANELRAAIENGDLAWGFDAESVGLFASEDLRESALEGAEGYEDQYKYFYVDVQDPVDALPDSNSLKRMVLLDIRWPAFARGSGGWTDNRANTIAMNQMIVPVALTRPYP